MSLDQTMESILKLGHQFMASRVLITGAELDLFSLLSEKPMTLDAIALEKKADRRGMGILLDALTSLGLLTKEGETYRVEASAAPHLKKGETASVLPMVLHLSTLWQTWSRLTDVVLGKPATRLRDQGALSEGHISAFIGAMHTVASKTAPEVVAAVDPGSARKLIDVGGGSGSYTIAFLNAAPDMSATLFDLPDVVKMAEERLGAAGLTDRVTLVPGDFYEDELPSGHDLALLSAIIHQNSPMQNRALFEKIYRALDPGGRIIVRDHVMSPDRTEPMDGALFAVNMLVGTPEGGTYTFDEIETELAGAGFKRIRLIRRKGMHSLVEGFKE